MSRIGTHHALSTLILAVALAGFAGCSKDQSEGGTSTAPTVDSVAGLWRFEFQVQGIIPGKDDADVSKYRLDQAGDQVTGYHCSTTYSEADGGGLIESGVTCDTTRYYSGVFQSPKLTLTAMGSDGTKSASIEANAAADGKTLSGTAWSAKCGCEFPVTAQRIEPQ